MHPVSDIVMWYATGQSVEDTWLTRKLKTHVQHINQRYRLQFETLAASTTRANLAKVWNEMFVDSVISWGRIITLISFACHLAQHFGTQEYAEEVAFRTRLFFNERLSGWVIGQGGWAAW